MYNIYNELLRAALTIRPPETEEEFGDYYYLRWKVMRWPFMLLFGTERGEHEEESYHLIAELDGETVGAGRISPHGKYEGDFWVHTVAVNEEHQGSGIGARITTSLEDFARAQGASTVSLNARENVVGFYEKLSYRVIEQTSPSYFGIDHFLMTKEL